MDKKPIYAALSAIVVLSSGCAYRPGTVRNNYMPGTRVVSPGAAAPRGTAGPNTNANTVSLNTASFPRVTAGSYNTTAGRTAGGYNAAAGNRIAARLGGAASLCDRIYAAAGTGNWQSCAALNGALKNTMTSSQPAYGQQISAGLSGAMTKLDGAIASRNASAVKKCSNQVLRELWNYSGTSGAGTLSRIVPVKYYCREVALSGDLATAKSCSRQMIKCWNGIRSTTQNTSIQKCVNGINNCLGRNDLTGAQKYCKVLLNQSPVANNSGTYGL